MNNQTLSVIATALRRCAEWEADASSKAQLLAAERIVAELLLRVDEVVAVAEAEPNLADAYYSSMVQAILDTSAPDITKVTITQGELRKLLLAVGRQ